MDFRGCLLLALLSLVAVPLSQGQAIAFVQQAPPKQPSGDQTSSGTLVTDFVQQYCLDCHNAEVNTAELDLSRLDLSRLDLSRGSEGSPADSSADRLMEEAETWEKVVRKLAAGQMPPAGMPRPQDGMIQAVLSQLTSALDQTASRFPNPGRTETMRRLTRTEYQNAIGDLLALRIDATTLLPPDQSSHGFDNVTVGELSPARLRRYVLAAQKISRLAVGASQQGPDGLTIRLPADLTQEEHVEGLPLGTRGGTLIEHDFPGDGLYEVQIRLARDRNEEVEGLGGVHQLEILLDRRQVAQFAIRPPKDRNHSRVDAHLKARLWVTAGPHRLGVTFLKNPSSLLETKRQPYQAHFNMHRHPRLSPAVYQVSLTGPYAGAGQSGDVEESDGAGSASAQGAAETPSRRRIFVCRPTKSQEEEACAKRILKTLMRRAYRRPVTDEDLVRPLGFYREGRRNGGFETGIERALSCILVNPHFLFRIERDPPGLPLGTAYRVSDVELASRLSFFLWSSLPDEELLELAIAGKLSQPQVLKQQVLRMLADRRAEALVTNFAGQWLYLQNLPSITPNLRLFPDFDDNLRQAFKKETELLFESIVREDRSVLTLLDAKETFLNERLAKHYGIPHIYGSRFRRVVVDQASRRGGLLRHGSVLTVTSYATRTSPVIRGHWILKNLLGAEPPPPPPNVPALAENTVLSNLSVRQRLAEHRNNAACASCHQLMDPVGLALENFDAVGRWRDREAGQPIDASGGLPDGSQFVGVSGLERALLARPELLVRTLAEKLLVYALGRGVEYHDAPAIRQIVKYARQQDDRFSALILGIVSSPPFQMRKTLATSQQTSKTPPMRLQRRKTQP